MSWHDAISTNFFFGLGKGLRLRHVGLRSANILCYHICLFQVAFYDILYMTSILNSTAFGPVHEAALS